MKYTSLTAVRVRCPTSVDGMLQQPDDGLRLHFHESYPITIRITIILIDYFESVFQHAFQQNCHMVVNLANADS
jgi:hypothetical protein